MAIFAPSMSGGVFSEELEGECFQLLDGLVSSGVVGIDLGELDGVDSGCSFLHGDGGGRKTSSFRRQESCSKSSRGI